MKKIDLAQAITILANIGVIAGIVFLAVELNQNSEQLRAQAQFSYMQSRANARYQIAFNPEVAEYLLKPADSMTQLEKERYGSLIEATILTMEWEYAQVLDGNLPDNRESLIGKWRSSWRPLFLPRDDQEALIHREAWSRIRSSLRVDFIEFWEQEIINPE